MHDLIINSEFDFINVSFTITIQQKKHLKKWLKKWKINLIEKNDPSARFI